jgi:hypothetical protein
MFSRRDVITGGVFAAAMRPAPAHAQQQQGCYLSAPLDIDHYLEQIRDAIKDLRSTSAQWPGEIAQIRERQRTHFKTNQKLPDYIDIGIQVWEHLYDWHLGTQLPLQVERRPDGRLQMQVMLSTLVLRPDYGDSQIGVPYDSQ